MQLCVEAIQKFCCYRVAMWHGAPPAFYILYMYINILCFEFERRIQPLSQRLRCPLHTDAVAGASSQVVDASTPTS